MDLKEFIIETVSSIVEASQELSKKHAAHGIVVNPPTNGRETDGFFEVGSAAFTKRRVQNVEFDVALTSGSSSSASGEAGGKLFVASAKMNGDYSRTNESISRVRFVVPLALPPSDAEEANRAKLDGYSPTKPVVGHY